MRRCRSRALSGSGRCDAARSGDCRRRRTRRRCCRRPWRSHQAGRLSEAEQLYRSDSRDRTRRIRQPAPAGHSFTVSAATPPRRFVEHRSRASRSSRTSPPPTTTVPLPSTTLERFDEALASYDRALALEPDMPRRSTIAPMSSMGSSGSTRRWRARPRDRAPARPRRSLQQPRQRAARSIASRRRWRATTGDRAQARPRRIPQQPRHRARRAQAARRGAGELRPRDRAQAGLCRGLQQSRLRAARSPAARRRAGELRPGARARARLPYLKGTYLHARMHVCDWTDFDDDCAEIRAAVAGGAAAALPFQLLASRPTRRAASPARGICVGDKYAASAARRCGAASATRIGASAWPTCRPICAIIRWRP